MANFIINLSKPPRRVEVSSDGALSIFILEGYKVVAPNGAYGLYLVFRLRKRKHMGNAEMEVVNMIR